MRLLHSASHLWSGDLTGPEAKHRHGTSVHALQASVSARQQQPPYLYDLLSILQQQQAASRVKNPGALSCATVMRTPWPAFASWSEIPFLQAERVAGGHHTRVLQGRGDLCAQMYAQANTVFVPSVLFVAMTVATH